MSALELHYVVEGRAEPEAPVLLLIGSLGSTKDIWEPVLPTLHRRFRVLRYDQRGHGRSLVPAGPYTVEALGNDALGLLDRLQVPRAAVCGTSLGGMVGQWLAVHAKPRVERLALLCTSAHLGPPDAWRDRAALVRREGTGAVADGVVSRWFTPAFAARSPEIVERMRRMVASTPAEGYAACCEAIAEWDIRAELANIEAPTLIVAGEDDPAIPPAQAYALGAAIPNARVTVLEHAAHLALAERPGPVLRLLLEHFDTAGAMAPTTDDERSALGDRVRRAVLGDAHVDRAKAQANDLDIVFQDFITRYAWGEIWARPELTRAERSMIALTVLATLHHEDEFAMHLEAALRNGLTREEIRELLLQIAIYAGVPTANRAFRIARKILG